MVHPNPLSRTDFHAPLSRPNRRFALHGLGVALAGAVLGMGLMVPDAFAAANAAPVNPTRVNPTQGTRPDQVLWRNNRGQIRTDAGTVLENSLQQTVVSTSRGDKSRNSDIVERVVFGTVPPDYVDGVAYFDRKEYEKAATKFKLAASDTNARLVVRASARLRAAQALMMRGAIDPGAFAAAKSEVETFLADNPGNREVPAARMLNGRATRLGGDAAAAAELYRSLFLEGASGTPTEGYAVPHCFDAGLAAAEAFLGAGETAQAQEIYGMMETGLPGIIAQLDPDNSSQKRLAGILANARLGQGYVMLATGSASQAKTFFQGQVASADVNSPDLMYGARLGLAEALLSEGSHRQAQIEFAFVSSMDHTSRDRVARALVGLAECALKLTDTTSRTDARTWLEDVRDHYGDTPSVLRAQELLKGL